MLFVLSGSVEIHGSTLGEPQTRRLQGGQFCSFSAEERVEITALNGAEMIQMSYYLDQNECAKYLITSLTQYQQLTEIAPRKLRMNIHLRNFLALLKEYMAKGMQCRKLVEMKEREVFTLLCTFYDERQLAGLFSHHLMEAIPFPQRIEIHYSRGVKSAQELAENYGCTERELNRLFRLHFGETPYQWMLQRKSHELRKRLADSTERTIDVRSLSEEFYFSSPSHLINFCKKYLGDTPTRLRRQFTQE